MYVEFDNFKEFEDFLITLDGQFLSPGGAVAKLGVPRQRIHAWIVRENWITAYKYKGSQGEFIVIPLEELEHEKIKNHIEKLSK